MSKAYVCLGKIAETPIKINKVEQVVYSIEELTYVLGENAYIVDSVMVNPNLLSWIEKECALPELATELKKAFSGDETQVSVTSFLKTLFDFTGYYSKERTEKILDYLNEASKLPPEERMKNAADFMAKEGYYKAALKMYRQQSDRLGKKHELTPRLYHNMGWVYVRLFLYNRAAELFLESFRMSGNEESLIQAMAAKRLSLSDSEYVEWVTSLRADITVPSEELERRYNEVSKEIASLREQRKRTAELLESDSDELYSELCVTISDLKEDYRRV